MKSLVNINHEPDSRIMSGETSMFCVFKHLSIFILLRSNNTIPVVYLDQHLGAAQSKCWSKYTTYSFALFKAFGYYSPFGSSFVRFATGVVCRSYPVNITETSRGTIYLLSCSIAQSRTWVRSIAGGLSTNVPSRPCGSGSRKLEMKL